MVKIVLVNKKKQILLQLRDKHVLSGSKWSLWGGAGKPGETPEEAIKREVWEEINYELADFRRIDELTTDTGMRRIWFYGGINKRISELTLHEGEDFKFASYAKAKTLPLTGNTARILKKIFEY